MNANMQRSDGQRSMPQGSPSSPFSVMASLKQQKAAPRLPGLGADSLFLPQQTHQQNMGLSTQPLPLPEAALPFDKTFKRGLNDVPQNRPSKKQRVEPEPPSPLQTLTTNNVGGSSASPSGGAPAPVPPSKEGLTFFADNDVLSGRGGGTNVHPGNRNFRDLINLHRRAYLKARKNDKPAISRAIVRAIRETSGRFLKKDEKSGLWYEIGDDAAREKTSQALRQRAPEMRKLLFDTEREEARVAAEEHIRQQRMLMGNMQQNMMGQNIGGMMNQGMGDMSSSSGMMNPSLFQAMTNKNMNMNMLSQQGGNDYAQMFSAAILQGGINRFAPNGA